MFQDEEYPRLREAGETAIFGRTLSDAGRWFRDYYDSIRYGEAAMTSPLWAPTERAKRALRKEYEENLAEMEKNLCDIFIKAVRQKDAATVLEIYENIVFFRENHKKVVDPERRYLIYLGSELRRLGKQMTVREIYEKMHGRKGQPSEDGFAALRRKCKELKVPLASRQIRRNRG